MVKFPEATARLYHNVFVCRSCKTKMRSTHQKIKLKELVCKNCGKRTFRSVRKAKQKAAA